MQALTLSHVHRAGYPNTRHDGDLVFYWVVRHEQGPRLRAISSNTSHNRLEMLRLFHPTPQSEPEPGTCSQSPYHTVALCAKTERADYLVQSLTRLRGSYPVVQVVQSAVRSSYFTGRLLTARPMNPAVSVVN